MPFDSRRRRRKGVLLLSPRVFITEGRSARFARKPAPAKKLFEALAALLDSARGAIF